MRMMSVERLTPGMVTALSVFAADGRILLQQGVKLTEKYIQRLRQLHFTYVYIEDPATDGIQASDSIPAEIRQEVVGGIKSAYDRMIGDGGRVSHFVNSGELGRTFVRLFDVLFNHIRDSNNLVVNLSAIYSSDAFLYTHCMNVGIMATVLGLARGYSEDMTKQLGVGAMLHDIGKVEIDPAVLNKPGKLTADERLLMEKHCEYGYDILLKQPSLTELSRECALLHHERFDGTGYPKGLKGDAIPDFGRVLAVPDVYDALASNRVYRKAFLPHEALEFLYANTGSHFDPEVVRLFSHHVNIYPVGLPVKLSNGADGVVAKVNPENVQRPIILVLEERGHSVRPYKLNLATELNVVVTGCAIPA